VRRPFELPSAFGGDDDMFRRDDVDAMGKRVPAQLGVDQRNMVRPSQIARYSGRFGIIRQTGVAFGGPLIERPMRVPIGASMSAR
jgi:hypothetical protein